MHRISYSSQNSMLSSLTDAAGVSGRRILMQMSELTFLDAPGVAQDSLDVFLVHLDVRLERRVLVVCWLVVVPQHVRAEELTLELASLVV